MPFNFLKLPVRTLFFYSDVVPEASFLTSQLHQLHVRTEFITHLRLDSQIAEQILKVRIQ